jgi:hypothetical protein
VLQPWILGLKVTQVFRGSPKVYFLAENTVVPVVLRGLEAGVTGESRMHVPQQISYERDLKIARNAISFYQMI